MVKKMITGSEALMQALIHEGVDTVFGYPGGSIMPVFDAMFDHQNDFKQVLVRHEQGAAHADRAMPARQVRWVSALLPADRVPPIPSLVWPMQCSIAHLS